MNRRGFFGRLLGGVVAVVGVKLAPKAYEVLAGPPSLAPHVAACIEAERRRAEPSAAAAGIKKPESGASFASLHEEYRRSEEHYRQHAEGRWPPRMYTKDGPVDFSSPGRQTWLPMHDLPMPVYKAPRPAYVMCGCDDPNACEHPYPAPIDWPDLNNPYEVLERRHPHLRQLLRERAYYDQRFAELIALAPMAPMFVPKSEALRWIKAKDDDRDADARYFAKDGDVFERIPTPCDPGARVVINRTLGLRREIASLQRSHVHATSASERAQRIIQILGEIHELHAQCGPRDDA